MTSKVFNACFIILSCVLCLPGNAQVNVRSYTRGDGTVVRAHQRSAPGGTGTMHNRGGNSYSGGYGQGASQVFGVEDASCSLTVEDMNRIASGQRVLKFGSECFISFN